MIITSTMRVVLSSGLLFLLATSPLEAQTEGKTIAQLKREVEERKLQVIDATCPLVTKVHLEAVRFAREGYTIVLIGHRDHDEVIGTLGEAPKQTVVVGSPEDVDRVEIDDPTRVGQPRQRPAYESSKP